MAQLHRYYIQHPDPLEQAGILRCDRSWYETLGVTLTEMFQRLDEDFDLVLPAGVREGVIRRIMALSLQVDEFPRTLVHGDFDPGNVVMLAEDQVGALDWGLAQCGVPLIDVAHMVGRFDVPTRLSMTRCYLESLNLSVFALDSEEAVLRLVTLGDLLHQAFFLWWHSRVVLNGWEDSETYRRAIWNRAHTLAAHAEMSDSVL